MKPEKYTIVVNKKRLIILDHDNELINCEELSSLLMNFLAIEGSGKRITNLYNLSNMNEPLLA